MARIPYWQIERGILMDLLAIPVIVIFCYGLYLHWNRIRGGQITFFMSWDQIRQIFKKRRVARFLLFGLLGKRVYQKPIAGLFHGMVFWGVFILFIGTVMVFFHVVFDMAVMSGGFYRWFMALTLDAAGLTVVVGIIFFFIRQLIHYPRIVDPKPRRGFIFAELLLLTILLSGFLLEGFRIHLTGSHENAFVGDGIARLLASMDTGITVYIMLWWTHGVLALFLIGFIPFSPLSHLFFVPVNAALHEPVRGADDKALDLSALEADPNGYMLALGSPTLADYHPRRRIDFSTCLWCGRCQEVCPATQTGKRLTPKGVMVTLAEWLSEGRMTDHGLIDAVGMETVFECRTCAACVEHCPAMVNPLKAIWNMRQHLLMERGELPANMLQAYRNLEALRHPFTSSATITGWKTGLDVPRFKANETEYLLWVGCAVVHEDRAQRIGRAMVRILNNAKISYGIIEEARCTGDPAKQMGDDYLFAQLANTNIAIFNTLHVKKIITICPHCYNSFKIYYPPLGGDYHVIPHFHLIRDLVHSGKVTFENSGHKIAYHDPCYLGRHNRVYDLPRDVLSFIGNVVELPRNRTNSFCCGAGGGNYWNEEMGQRISYTRAQEAFETGADRIATACPFCLLMLTDGMKMFTEDKIIFDIAELVEQHYNFAADGG